MPQCLHRGQRGGRSPKWAIDDNSVMEWPIPFSTEMNAGTVSVLIYEPTDALELFESLANAPVWEHMSRAAPADVDTLDEVIRSKLGGGYRKTFTMRQGGHAVGITSVMFDPEHPGGVEVGGTLLDPGVWGTGVNAAVKRMLLAEVFRHGAEWVQLRTDERNGRSAAAILKLGAHELAPRDESFARRDGTRRRSRIFKIERLGSSMPA